MEDYKYKENGKEKVLTGEIMAVISMALHEAMDEVHDIESGKLTIRHNVATLWNAKFMLQNEVSLKK